MFFKKRQNDLEDSLAKYVSLEGGQLASSESHGILDFMIILVAETEPPGLTDLISKCVTLISANRGVVSTITSSLIVATFGFPFDETGSVARRETADRLSSAFGSSIRIVHGSEAGSMGNQGTSKILHYGPRISDFAGKLQTLLNLPAGGVKELSG
jgi:hypothetical protein